MTLEINNSLTTYESVGFVETQSIAEKKQWTDLAKVEAALPVKSIPETNRIAFSKVIRWLRHCHENHHETCNSVSAPRSLHKIKVIDCRTRQLCEIKTQQP